MSDKRDVVSATAEEEVHPSGLVVPERPMHTPTREHDTQPGIPPKPSIPTNDDLAGLSPKQRADMKKWTVSFKMVLFILSVLFGIFAVDTAVSMIRPGTELALRDPLFEALRMLLFAVSGYIFAKSTD